MSDQTQPAPTPSANVTTDQIMDFLVENMVTRKEFDYELDGMHGEMSEIKNEMSEIKKVIVTKDDLGKHRSEMINFIDKRLLDLKTDLVVIVKGEDQKLIALIELMKKKELLTHTEAQGLLQMNPLAQAA